MSQNWADDVSMAESEDAGVFADCPCHCPKFDVSPATSDFVRYCMMATLFTLIVFADTSTTEAFHVGRALRDLLLRNPVSYASEPFAITFDNVLDRTHLWMWIDQVVMHAMHIAHARRHAHARMYALVHARYTHRAFRDAHTQVTHVCTRATPRMPRMFVRHATHAHKHPHTHAHAHVLLCMVYALQVMLPAVYRTGVAQPDLSVPTQCQWPQTPLRSPAKPLPHGAL